MRVGYLVSRYPAVSHTFIRREIAALRERGVDVRTVSIHAAGDADAPDADDRRERAATATLLPPRPGDVAAAVLEAARKPAATARLLVRSVRTPGPPMSRRLAYVLEALLLRQALGPDGPRHVHAHFANVAADVARLAVAFGNDVDHDGGWTWSFTMHGPTELADVARFDLRGKVEDADAVVCISDYCRSQLMALVEPSLWHKLTVVHCGVDADGFEPAVPDLAGALRILTVGRLVPEKGHSVLVDAIGRLRRRGVDVELTVVGDGPARGRLEQQVVELGLVDHVLFVGATGLDDVLRHHRLADVFCLPSFAEGVPVVLMEAMATGVPVVTTRIAGIPELVEDGVSGLLVAPGRADQLEAAIATLAAEPELREKLGCAGRAKVAEDFDQRRSAATLAALFEGVAVAR